jgi:hypothetical protein
MLLCDDNDWSQHCELGSLRGFQQAILCILLLIGNLVFVSTFVVLIRRHFFRYKLADIIENSKSGREVLEDIERQERGQSNEVDGSPSRGASSIRQSSSRENDDTMRRRLICECLKTGSK